MSPAKHNPKSTSLDATAHSTAPAPSQAVIIAEHFNQPQSLLPLSADLPQCFIPVCNIPVLEYTLEMLAANDVRQAFIFITKKSDLLKQYIQNSKWSKYQTRLKVQIFACPKARSEGDILRELDAQQLIKGDFFLVHGDLVSNMDIATIMKAHSEIKEKDKNAIMTMVLREASVLHRTREVGESGLFVLDAQTSECFHYESLLEPPKKFEFEKSKLNYREKFLVRNDLIDCQIDICSLEVPALFTENFDYQTIRGDFVHGVLTSDLLGKTIYAHLVANKYAQRIRSPRLYDAISKDVMARWSFPFVPDMNFRDGDAYQCLPGRVYREPNVKLDRSAHIKGGSVIGAGVVVGPGVVIEKSTIGRKSSVEANTLVENSYIWENVRIGQGCRINHAIIANNVQVFDNTIIEPGCILSENVKIGPNVTLKSGTRISLSKPRNDDDFSTDDEVDDDDDLGQEEEEEQEGINRYDASIVGSKGEGYVWKSLSESDSLLFDITDKTLSTLSTMPTLPEGEVSSDSDEYSEDDHSLLLDEDHHHHHEEQQQQQEAVTEDEDADFKRELKLTLDRAFHENHSVEIAALELKTLRMAYDASHEDIRDAVLEGIIREIEKANKPWKSIIQQWAPLLGRMARAPREKLQLIFLLQELCSSTDLLSRYFSQLLHQLYELDLVEEELIMKWWQSPKSDDINKKLKESALPFINWLKEAEEEDGDDEESQGESP